MLMDSGVDLTRYVNFITARSRMKCTLDRLYMGMTTHVLSQSLLVFRYVGLWITPSIITRIAGSFVALWKFRMRIMTQ